MPFLDALVNNPVSQAIGHAAGSLWNMTDLAQNLKAAADQHAKLQNAQAMQQLQYQDKLQQQQFENERQLRSMGGTPINPDSTTTGTVPGSASPATGGKGLVVRPGAQQSDAAEAAQNDAQQGQGLMSTLNQASQQAGFQGSPQPAAPGGLDNPAHRMHTPWGVDFHMPDDAERADSKRRELAPPPLDDTNSSIMTGDLIKALHLDQFGVQPGQRISYESIDKLGQSLGHFAPKPGRYDPTTYNTPAMVDESTGTAKPVTMAPGMTAAPKPDAQQIISGRVGPNGGPMVYDKTTKKMVEVDPAGSTREATPGQEMANEARGEAAATRADAARQRQEDKQQGVRNAAQKQIEDFQDREQKQHALRQGYGDAMKIENGQPVVDPGKGGQPQLMSDAIREYYRKQLDQATKAAASYHDRQQKLIVQNGGTIDSQNSPNPGTNTAGGVQQQATQSGAPSTTGGTTPQQKNQKLANDAAKNAGATADEADQRRQQEVDRNNAAKPAAQAPAAPPKAQTPAPAPSKPLAPWSGLAKPGGAKSKGTLTDPNIVSGYVKKAGGNKDIARRLARADGWEF